MNKGKVIGYLIRSGVLLLLVALAAAGWYYWQKSKDVPLTERYVQEELSTGDVTQTVTANGTLNPVVLVNVGTQVSGTVKKLYADFNSKVMADQVLLELDPTTFRAAVEQSTGNVANADASLKLARANEERTVHVALRPGISRELVFNGDNKHKFDPGTTLNVIVRREDGEVAAQGDTCVGLPNLRLSRYWSVPVVLSPGRYAVTATTTNGVRYAALMAVRDDLDEPRRTDVPSVRQ